MRTDNYLVMETIGPLDVVIQVHVAEFVDLLAPVVGANEAQLGDEDLGLINRWISVHTSRIGIAGIGNQRGPDLACYRHARQTEIADLVSRQTVIFLLRS